jgi:uncharacterized protein YigE (DUF2233 family)
MAVLTVVGVLAVAAGGGGAFLLAAAQAGGGPPPPAAQSTGASAPPAAPAASAPGPAAPSIPSPGSPAGPEAADETAWEVLDTGLSLAEFPSCSANPPGAAHLTVLRADPANFDFRLLAVSNIPEAVSLTAREWAEAHDLAVATNAGMYQTDYRTHVGYMADGEHVNSAARPKNYKSVLAFHPKRKRLPPFELADLEEKSFADLESSYRVLIQNLRMVDHRGVGVWAPSERRSSAVALGVDGSGRILFLFTRSPISVHDLIACLLSLPIDLRRAQYLEGGPEASLVVRTKEGIREWLGTYEGGFTPEDPGKWAWRLPNVIGLTRRAPPAGAPPRSSR